MTVVRVRGFKIYKDRHGKMRCYHRKSGYAVDLLNTPLGTAEFFAVCAKISGDRTHKIGTFGDMIQSYQKSPRWNSLRPKTQEEYSAVFRYLNPFFDKPSAQFTTLLVTRICDKAHETRSWDWANRVRRTLSMLFEWGIKRGLAKENPAKSVEKIKRPKDMEKANRPWSDLDRYLVLDLAPPHMVPVIATMAYTGMNIIDAITLRKADYKDGEITKRRTKTGEDIFWEVSEELRAFLDKAPKHDEETLFVNSHGKPWTKSGFSSSWHKFRAPLVKKGVLSREVKLAELRHTAATLLREAGAEKTIISDGMGHKSKTTVETYVKGADTRKNMREARRIYEEEDRKRREALSNQIKKLSNLAKE